MAKGLAHKNPSVKISIVNHRAPQLGIDQVSTALAKLHMTNNSRGGGSDPQGSRHPDLERDLIRCMAQAQDRLDVLEAAAAAAAVSTSSSEASSVSDSSPPPPPTRTTTGLSNSNYVADFARPTVASSLKSTCRPTMDPNPPSPRSTPGKSHQTTGFIFVQQ